MALKRPGFKPNLKASMASTTSDKIFFDLKPDTTVRVRVLPPSREDGSIWTVAVNHFRLKNEEGRGVALACLGTHGEEGQKCWLCAVSQTLKKFGTKEEQEIGDTIRPNPRWYLQALVAETSGDSLEYFGPKLVGLPKTAAAEVNAIMSAQDQMKDDYFMDPDKGQDLLITRTGAGYQTRYKVMATGQKSALDEVAPGWDTKFIKDVYAQLGLNVWSEDEVEAAFMRTYGDRLETWDQLRKERGL